MLFCSFTKVMALVIIAWIANLYDCVSGLHVCLDSFTDGLWQRAKLNIACKKHGHFDTCLTFAVDCMYLHSVCLCQEQCVQEGEWPKQELTVLQWADWAIPVYSLQMSHGKRDVNSAAGWAKFSSVPVLRLQKDIWTCSWIFIYQYGHIDELCH